MSLLMEALKKAEAAKRQSQVAATGEEGGPALELAPLGEPPTTGEETTPPPLPDLPSHLEILDAEFLESAQKARRPAPPAAEPKPAIAEEIPFEPALAKDTGAPPARGRAPHAGLPKAPAIAQQEAVQNLFDVKQPAPSRKNFAVAMGLFSLIAAVSIGIYFWLQLQPKSQLTMVARTPPPPAVPAQPPVAAPPPATATPAPAPIEAAEEDEPVPTKQARAVAADASTPAPPPTSPIRVATAARARLDPSVERGYNALQQGDLATAQSAYDAALKADPGNLDALHGMAATSLRLGNGTQAEFYFQRALEVDPKDGYAVAGLANLRVQAGTPQMESRLKGALAEQPDNPAVSFALGNVYAQQNRWGDAQQAYFRAMTGDPDNADYLFNLAVALDHLRQSSPAAQFYAKALEASKKRPGGFDPALAMERLKKLQP